MHKQMISRDSLISNLDAVFYEYIKKRDRYSCVITGDKRNLQLYRFVNSSAISVKYDPDNACLLSKKFGDGVSMRVVDYFLHKFSMSQLLDMERKKCYPVSDGRIIALTNELVAMTDPIRCVGRWD